MSFDEHIWEHVRYLGKLEAEQDYTAFDQLPQKLRDYLNEYGGWDETDVLAFYNSQKNMRGSDAAEAAVLYYLKSLS